MSENPDYSDEVQDGASPPLSAELDSVGKGLREQENALSLLNTIEESVSGKPIKWTDPNHNLVTSALPLLIAITITLISTSEKYNSTISSVSINEIAYLAIFGITTFILWWVPLLTLFKGSILKSFGTAFLGIIAAVSIYSVFNWIFHFLLIEADWGIVLAGRVQLFAGHDMNYMMSVEGQISQTWRLWIILGIATTLISAAYGTSEIPSKTFFGYAVFITMVIISFTWYPENRNYDADAPISKFAMIALLGSGVFSSSRIYCNKSEEFQINKLRTYLSVSAVIAFFVSIYVMDPPDFIVERGFAESGVEPMMWGGLFVNLILATAGGVMGLGIGAVLAFGRQSEIPIFKWPSVALIEIVRAGPMIAWLYFAKYLLGGVMEPFSSADVIMRTLLMFSFFGGVYTAEILRGGMQSVRTGQIEAATALGLSPLQIKLTVILPNSVRTTLPSLVSLLIGLWKDTTLIFIIGVFDFYKVAADLPTSDLEFALNILEPLYLAGFVFWIIAYYLSRLSLGIEKKLGLGNTTGGEIT